MKRIKYYDLLRILCFSLVIYYHMTVQLAISGLEEMESLAPLWGNGNMHVATLAVAVFFMLSGACLQESAKGGFETRKYYVKRFFSLIIPFYVTEALYFIYLVIFNREKLAGYSAIPLRRLFYTVSAMDEWVSMHGTRTFSFTIGEWFLGAMVVLSLLFPLLHYLVEKYRKPFFFFITVCYLLAAWKYNGIRIRFCPEVPYNMSILFKGYEFVLGMYLPGILGNGGKRRAAFFIPVVLLFLFCKDSFPVTDILKITVLSVSVFGSASLLEPWLQKNDHGFLKKAGAFTYPVYLVHHLVIYELTPVFAPHIHQTPGYLLLFFCELLLMVPLAYLVKKLSEMLTGKLKKTQ